MSRFVLFLRSLAQQASVAGFNYAVCHRKLGGLCSKICGRKSCHRELLWPLTYHAIIWNHVLHVDGRDKRLTIQILWQFRWGSEIRRKQWSKSRKNKTDEHSIWMQIRVAVPLSK